MSVGPLVGVNKKIYLLQVKSTSRQLTHILVITMAVENVDTFGTVVTVEIVMPLVTSGCWDSSTENGPPSRILKLKL